MIYPVVMAKGVHLFPSRTQKLSPYTSKVLGWKRPGRIDSCRLKKKHTLWYVSFFIATGKGSAICIAFFAFLWLFIFLFILYLSTIILIILTRNLTRFIYIFMLIFIHKFFLKRSSLIHKYCLEQIRHTRRYALFVYI